MFNISVCMIVKDEEKTLDRILSQVSQIADEIIIVDTGSKDNTINIAKKYTDKTYSYAWNNDFSSARNFSFSKASKDYLIWLDADDVISQENIIKINNLKQTNLDIDVYMCKYKLSDNFEFYRERILKRTNNYKFEGKVHEAISIFGKIEYSNITIEHRKEKVSDKSRNLKIYRSMLKNNYKFSARDMYYYARELYYHGFYKTTIKTLKKYLKMNDPYTPNIVGANIILSDCYELLGNFNKALHTLLTFAKYNLPTAEICCKIAYLYEKTNFPDLAIFWYKNALNCDRENSGFINTDYYEYIPYMELCRLYYPIDYPQSKKYHLLAKKIKPSDTNVNFNEQFFVE